MYQIKPVFDYLSMYEVDNEGNVWSLKGTSRRKLKPNRQYQVVLSDGHNLKTFPVGRLVADAFIENPNPSKLKIILHKDGDVSNNNASNLEWGTYLEVQARTSKGKRRLMVDEGDLELLAHLPNLHFDDNKYNQVIYRIKNQSKKLLEE